MHELLKFLYAYVGFCVHHMMSTSMSCHSQLSGPDIPQGITYLGDQFGLHCDLKREMLHNRIGEIDLDSNMLPTDICNTKYCGAIDW